MSKPKWEPKMVERRTPPPKDKFPPRALELFERMLDLKDTDDKWWELHSELMDILHVKTFEFPCVVPPWVEMSGEFVASAKVRFLALAEACDIEFVD
jgi:hypothetical protein